MAPEKKNYVTPEFVELGKFTKLTEASIFGDGYDGNFPEDITECHAS